MANQGDGSALTGGEDQGDNHRSGSPLPQTPSTPTSRPMYPTFRQFVRQNSEKMGHLAEEICLPVNKRSGGMNLKKVGAIQEVESIALESQAPSPPSPGGPLATINPAAEPLMAEKPYAPTTTVVIIGGAEGEKGPFKPAFKFPFFMVLVSAVQVALYYDMSEEDLLLWFGYDPHRRHEVWRFFTIMLAHSSSSHLWGNVIFQLILGCLLEIVHHWKRIFIIYMASVLGGSLFITALGPTSYGVGASAGVYGLLFAHLSTIILNWAEMDKKCCRLFWLLFYIALDIGINSWVQFGLKYETHTSHAGHIGGAITGFLVAILVLKNFEKHPWEKKLQKICAGILAGLFILILLVNVSIPSYYEGSVFNFEYHKTYVRYILKAIKDSVEDSPIRKVCEADDECQKLLERYLHNETIPEDLSAPLLRFVF